MKNVSFVLIIILFTACSGSKNLNTNLPNETVEKVILKDVAEVEKLSNSNPVSTETKAQIEDVSTEKTPIIETFSHSKWNELLQKYVSPEGNVNYKGFKVERKKLLAYISDLSENTPAESWNKQAQLAYWINTYNTLTVDLILRNYPMKSIKVIKDPWEQRLWKLNGKWYNLNDIEHKILRNMDEPRMHFAIVCASVSCPKLLNEAYTSEHLEAQLTKATTDFLSDTERNVITENSIELSKIFQWFAKDFKQNGNVIDFINQYSEVKISEKTKKSFKDYNWDLNE